VVGPDARIYGTGTRGNQVGLYIYDPKLGKVVKDFGALGPKHPNGAWSRYVMGVDETHAYIASGMIPAWYLVAVNLETGEEKVLLESPTERVMDIIESFPSAYVRIPQVGAANKEYWLYHGEAIAKVNGKPPWPKQNSPWAKAVPKPEVYFDQIDPDESGNAMVWYRSREARQIKRRFRVGNPFVSKASTPIPIASIRYPCCRMAGSTGQATIMSARSFSIPEPMKPFIAVHELALRLTRPSLPMANFISAGIQAVIFLCTTPRGPGRWARADLPAVPRRTRPMRGAILVTSATLTERLVSG
jgi:hypothetical protein